MAQRVREWTTDPSGFMRVLLESQQQQNERVTVALEKIAASESQTRQGNVSDFRRLHPAAFTGEESYLDAEQWLIDTQNLLVAARVPKADRVDVVKIQLLYVARTWWLAEESHLLRPISWKTFFEVFLAKFFPKTTKLEIEQKFINLRQARRIVDGMQLSFPNSADLPLIWSLLRRTEPGDFSKGLMWSFNDMLFHLDIRLFQKF